MALRKQGSFEMYNSCCRHQLVALRKQGSFEMCPLLLQAATILAKQLVALRKQRTKSYAAGSKIQAIGNQQKVTP